MTHIRTDEGIVFLLDKAIVILVPGTTARDLNSLDFLLPETQQVII